MATSIDADVQTVRRYVSLVNEIEGSYADLELVEEHEIREAIQKYCSGPVSDEPSDTVAEMLSELCTLSLHRRCERGAKSLKEFYENDEGDLIAFSEETTAGDSISRTDLEDFLVECNASECNPSVACLLSRFFGLDYERIRAGWREKRERELDTLHNGGLI